MKLTREQVLHVAALARLTIAEEEVERVSGQLSSILDYVDQIGKLPLESVKPMSHALDVVNAFREDRARPSLERDAALANAPEPDEGCFRVPKVIEA